MREYLLWALAGMCLVGCVASAVLFWQGWIASRPNFELWFGVCTLGWFVLATHGVTRR